MSDSEVRYLKLITGEEIVATVVGIPGPGGYREVSDAVAVVPQFNQATSQIIYQFIPWGMEVEQPVLIGMNHIVYDATPRQAILENYTAFKAQKAGLTLPNKPSSLLI